MTSCFDGLFRSLTPLFQMTNHYGIVLIYLRISAIYGWYDSSDREILPDKEVFIKLSPMSAHTVELVDSLNCLLYASN